MIKPKPCFSVFCDRCGADAFGDDEISGWDSPDYAREVAQNGDYLTIDDRDYCPRCLIYDDETDEHIPNPEPFVPEPITAF